MRERDAAERGRVAVHGKLGAEKGLQLVLAFWVRCADPCVCFDHDAKIWEGRGVMGAGAGVERGKRLPLSWGLNH